MEGTYSRRLINLRVLLASEVPEVQSMEGTYSE